MLPVRHIVVVIVRVSGAIIVSLLSLGERMVLVHPQGMSVIVVVMVVSGVDAGISSGI